MTYYFIEMYLIFLGFFFSPSLKNTMFKLVFFYFIIAQHLFKYLRTVRADALV